jgi:hypothetical protein
MMEETPMDQPRSFDAFTIIYNPNSTGDVAKLPKALHDDWVPQLPGTDVGRERAGQGGSGQTRVSCCSFLRQGLPRELNS